MDAARHATAIVGVGAILPDAPSAGAFWQNIVGGRYSITEVPTDRWRVDLYYDPDPRTPDKSYSKIGGWVLDYEFDWRRFRMPPKVAAAMDQGQQWAVTIAADALADYGYPNRSLETRRTAVILGTAMGGELHYVTHARIIFPEYADALAQVSEFKELPAVMRKTIIEKWHDRVNATKPSVTEDSMPGELPNIVSGRVANMLNLRGPNFITDAACASSFAAIQASVQLLSEHQVDAVITGGVDHNMGVSSFVKFCKIGALSATGSRPFGEGADGFVMGEGAATFVLKRLADAERDGDKIYAVIRGVGGASDGKGKGITAPNPIGQQLAMQRAWEHAGIDPATATLIEAHGTSTRVGDVVEVESLAAVFGDAHHSIGLGSAKSNIGHLKAGAGAAGLLKAAMATYEKILPPTLNARKPNPHIDFEQTPFQLIHEPQAWEKIHGEPRRCGVSAYGFGGTNFHIVLEEHVSGMLTEPASTVHSASFSSVVINEPASPPISSEGAGPLPVRGILALGAATPAVLQEELDATIVRVENGWVPPKALPTQQKLAAQERLIIDFGNESELLERLRRAQKAMSFDSTQTWKAMHAQGIFRGSGPAQGKIAFLFPGQGSQYINMGRELVEISPAVAEVFADADRIMKPILGRPLTDYIFVDADDPSAMFQAQFDLMQTEITQPAMLTLDIALLRLLDEYGFKPEMVMGHSLGEYAALIAAGSMPFSEALEAAAARGSEMSKVSLDDNGKMAAVLAPFDAVQEILDQVDGYVVTANINSHSQCVIGGASQAVEDAVKLFEGRGYRAMNLPVSHAFHTSIVSPASEPLRQVLDRLHIAPPRLPVVANVTGELYPTEVNAIKDLLQTQVAAPVQWVKGLETLYDGGVRTFVEVGPKRALRGFANDVFKEKDDVLVLLTNHPKFGALPTFNQALCGLYAAGHGGAQGPESRPQITRDDPPADVAEERYREKITLSGEEATPISLDELGRMLSQVLQQTGGQTAPASAAQLGPYDRNEPPQGSVVISGTGLGLPGAEKSIMDPDNAMRILRGEQFVDLIPARFRQRMVDKHIVRLVKSSDGSGSFVTIDDSEDVIKLAGRPGRFDLHEEYDVPEKLIEALDITSQLAMAAGLDALREAGIPLIQTFKHTTAGTYLPQSWVLPEALRDETGVIFASAFPASDRFADEFRRFYEYRNRQQQLEALEDLRRYTREPATLQEISRRVTRLHEQLDAEPYHFDRRFLFRILSMGHSQFAQHIGARGPNTQINAACASTAQGVALAEDWIRIGRCRRVIVISADDVTSDNLMEWVGAGFLAVGAASTGDKVEEAALPFDRRRNGTILGMGASALIIESEDAVRERGMRGIVELLSSETSNSAYHGTRLDANHIAQVLDRLVTTAERRFGIHRGAIAPQTVFVSHETYTPARGGSAAAEVVALRKVFAEAANEIIIANTKGFTGHPMGVGIEDVIGVKILEHGIVPPVPNFEEMDPDLGPLNLSRGGRYPVQYAIHLAAGFGSQIALSMTRRIPGNLDRLDNKSLYSRWLADISGHDRAETEVVKRVLRIKANGRAARQPVPSRWQYGTGPVTRARVGSSSAPVVMPARMILPEDQAPAEEKTSNGRTLPAAQSPLPETRKTTEIAPAPTPAPVYDFLASETPEARPEPVAAPPISEPTGDSVAEQVLALVAEQTGYPEDMLDLDLELEADLGIDTVKQAETFAAIREAFDIPRRDDLSLGDYNTLKKVIGFVHEMRPDLATVPVADGGPAQAFPPSSAQSTDDAPALPASDLVAAQVLAIVAEQTGYPEDMLDLDLELEADLGIDTVKQAETFAAIREAFDIPRRDDLSLGDYNTLEKVIGFVHEMRPALDVGEPAGRIDQEKSASRAAVSKAIDDKVFDLALADRLPRRVPLPAPRPALDICKPTGIVLDENSRVLIMHDQGGVGKAIATHLEKSGAEVLSVEADLEAAFLEGQLRIWLEEGPIQGVYWLPALDAEPDIEEMDLETWREMNRRRVKNLAITMRALYEVIDDPGTFLISATGLGGLHGYGPNGATAPLGGAVAGFTKAYKRERADVLVKVIDFERGREAASAAEKLISETLYDAGVIEVGYSGVGRFTVTLVEQPAANGALGMILDKESVFLITGAAGSITSAIIADLATASGGTFYLLDLVAEPDPADERIQLFRADRDALKQKLVADARAAGERPTPVFIEKQMLAVERGEAALSAIESVRAAGGTPIYRSVSLLDCEALSAIVAEIRERYGRIDVLLHAGGIEISRALNNKPQSQFEQVFDIKVDGFFTLLHAAAGMPIGATVAFSSVAGRFGNSGQTDYSAANDLLGKVTSSMRRWRPDTRGIVIDWTAWGGIGMATRGSVPKIMEMAGIELLPPEVGIPTVRRELVAGSFRGEIVVAGKLGILIEERDESGGLDLNKANAWLADNKRLMIGKIKAARIYGGLEVETTLDPQEQPFLYDHALNGTPVLPGVMGTEAFAQLATLLTPNLQVQSVVDEQLQSLFKFYQHQPQTLHLHSFTYLSQEGDLIARTELRSIRELAKPGLPPKEKVHFKATVLLSEATPERPEAVPIPQPADDDNVLEAEEIYRIYFHGPAYKVLDKVSVSGDRAIGLMANDLPPNASPADCVELMAPRLIELCFQTVGVWEMRTKHVMALPSYIGRVTVYPGSDAGAGRVLYAFVEAVNGGDSFTAHVVGEDGTVYVSLKDYRTVQLPGDVEL